MDKDLKLPSSINLLGHWVKIKYVHDIPGSQDEYVHGNFILETNTINIRITNADDMYKTLVHECFHAMLAYSGLGQVLDEKTEEGLCCLSEYFTKLFSLRKSGYIRWKRKAIN